MYVASHIHTHLYIKYYVSVYGYRKDHIIDMHVQVDQILKWIKRSEVLHTIIWEVNSGTPLWLKNVMGGMRDCKNNHHLQLKLWQ